MGTAKDIVFPLPVGAETHKSRGRMQGSKFCCIKIGITLHCTGKNSVIGDWSLSKFSARLAFKPHFCLASSTFISPMMKRWLEVKGDCAKIR